MKRDRSEGPSRHTEMSHHQNFSQAKKTALTDSFIQPALQDPPYFSLLSHKTPRGSQSSMCRSCILRKFGILLLKISQFMNHSSYFAK